MSGDSLLSISYVREHDGTEVSAGGWALNGLAALATMVTAFGFWRDGVRWGQWWMWLPLTPVVGVALTCGLFFGLWLLADLRDQRRAAKQGQP